MYTKAGAERMLADAYRARRYVDMTRVGFSTGSPLYTDSVANCLVAIVHNRDHDAGAMMHMFPALVGATDYRTLLASVDEELERMLAQVNGGGRLELLLWKGISFVPIGHEGLKKAHASLNKHVEQRYGHRFDRIIDLLDHEGISTESAMLYLPTSGQVFIVDTTTEGALNKIEKADPGESVPGVYSIPNREPGSWGKRIQDLIQSLGAKTDDELLRIFDRNRGFLYSEDLDLAVKHELLSRAGVLDKDPYYYLNPFLDLATLRSLIVNARVRQTILDSMLSQSGML